MATIIGVDVGGTFTDFFILDSTTGRSAVFKTPSTPARPADAVAGGLARLVSAQEIRPEAVGRVAHGTTVGTNALIQRKGASVSLLVTRGFRDLLEIGRQTRPHLYSLQIDGPPPLVPRQSRIEVDERVLADGSVKRPLTEADACRLVAELQSNGSEAIAVCLLFSFLNTTHEQRLKELLEAAGHRHVSISSEVQPEFREYERMSTTVLNAYLQPVMADYLRALEDSVECIAPKATLRINQSSGGLMSATQAAKFPVRTALSGPAAGVVGATYIARTAGRTNLITLDMGGTSADVCLIRDGAFSVSYEGMVGGFPIRLPMVDVNAVGAGGGSIAWIDRDGLMKVGPMSAGAQPGPACYGLGGEHPTVTDANLLLGRLAPEGLLGGKLALDANKACAAFEEIASKLGTSVEHAALGCLDIVIANMARAIRAISVERGHDPKDFSLLAFGGGGPLHARGVAASLGINEIIVPLHPGILCAQGLLAADVSESFVMTCRTTLTTSSHAHLLGALESLIGRANAWFAQESASADERRVSLVLDMRYVGQNYELSVPVDLQDIQRRSPLEGVRLIQEAFQAAHEQEYGTINSEAAVEVVNMRVTARIATPLLRDPEKCKPCSRPAPRPRGYRSVHFGGPGRIDCPIYDRDALMGCFMEGPAIIEQLDTTTLVFPGDRMYVDGASNVIIEVAR